MTPTVIADYAKGDYAGVVMLNVIILSVVMMSVIVLLIPGMFLYLAIIAICRHLSQRLQMYEIKPSTTFSFPKKCFFLS